MTDPLTKVTLRELTAEERQVLGHLASSRTAQARFVERVRILLAIADGRRPSQVATDLGVSQPTVYTWIHRFNDRGSADWRISLGPGVRRPTRPSNAARSSPRH